MVSDGVIKIQGTEKTPTVNCDAASGEISLTGICVPEDAISFFTPIKDWIEDYIKDPKDQTDFTIDLQYFNTSTSRILLNIFRLMMGLNDKGHQLQILWVYEEDDWDMKEAGEDYMEIVGDALVLKPKPTGT